MALQSRRNIIVIGGNFAGISVARALYHRHFQVTLLDPGTDFEWYPNIHELVSRQKKPLQLRHSRQQLLERLGHRFLNTSVTAIDRRQQRVMTSTGQWLAYDDLVIAAGNTSTIGLVPGAREHALPFGTVAEAERVALQLQRLDSLSMPVRPVAIIGAGFEGLEVLGEMVRRYRKQWRFQVHMIDTLPELMPTYLGLDGYLKELVEDLDIIWHQGCRVTSIGKDEVLLDNGTLVPSRLTLWCGGAMPHPLLAEAGLAEFRQYAPVERTLQSSHDPHVWIAGNAARFHAPLDKQAYHAIAMGSLIGANLRRVAQRRAPGEFRPLPLPKLMSFGETGFVLFQSHALAHPGVVAAKEAVFQANFNRINLPRRPHEWADLKESLAGSAMSMVRLARQTWLDGTLLNSRRFEAV